MNDPKSDTPSREPIAIVGMSCLFPKAQTLEEYWSNLRRGVDAITEVPATHWRTEDFFDDDPKNPDHTYARRGGFLDSVDYDPSFFGVAPNNLAATDATQLLSLIVAHGALQDAGYTAEREFNRERVSVIMGVTGALQLATTIGGRLGHPIWRRALRQAGLDEAKVEEVVQTIGDSYAVWQENTFPGLLGNVVAGRIANRLNLGGTNCVVDAACASSMSAAHLAAMELESGRADMVLTGGADCFNDIFMYMCFSKTPALSPTGNAKPFDTSADGTILGEGIGMVALKRLSDARRDGDRVYAVIKGIGSSSDGRGKAIYAPSADGQERCLRAAYRQAGITPDSIDLVEAHGTGTKVGDATEVSALKKVYREARGAGVWCALGSVKSQIGHTKAAAGVAGLIKAALALRYKVLPPTIKVTEPARGIMDEDSPFYVNAERRPWFSRAGRARRAAVSAFGFGGSNFHVALEEDDPRKLEIDWDGRVQIAAFSADTMQELRGRFAALKADAPWSETRRVATLSRREFSVHRPYRLLVVLEKDKTDVARLVPEIARRLETDAAERWSMPEGVYFGRGEKHGKLAFLFPGQGSQYVGMCRDLVCLFPKMHEVLTDANLAYGDYADIACQLSDFIFPHATFTEEARKLNELALRATHVAQPAIGAVSLGLVCVLAMFGAHPAMAGGHSFGELVALFAGGKITQADLHRLAQLRGRLMGEGEGDRGSMLAAQAPIEDVQRAIDEENLKVTLANKNAPNQVALSGATADIERAQAALKARKITATRLPVGAAFHSELVAAATEPFRRGMDDAEFSPGAIPVYANATAEVYPEDGEAAKDLLAGQIARPVEFVRQIERMHEDGARVFLEVGPGRRVTGLVGAILGSRDHVALAVDASSGKGDGAVDLARALAQIGALGFDLTLEQWDPLPESALAEPAKKSGIGLKISGANQGNPYSEQALRSPAAAAKNGGAVVAASAGKTNHNEGGSNTTGAPVAAAPARPTIPMEGRSVMTPMRESQAPTAPVSAPEVPPRVAQSGPIPITPAPIAQISASLNSVQAGGPHHNPAPAPADPIWAEVLRSTQENLAALQRLQEQTSHTHRHFLQTQEQALGTFNQLFAQQQRLFERALGMEPSAAPVVSAPIVSAPVALAPVAAPAPAYSEIPSPPPRVREASFVSAPAPVQAPAVQAPAPAAPLASPAPSNSGRDLGPILLQVVAEKTGYPVEMLNLEMDLESDLGVDSIKRVEIMSALQEREPGLPEVAPDQLGSLRTLGQIAEVLRAAGPAAVETGSDPGLKSGPPDGLDFSVARTSVRQGMNSNLGALLLEIVSEKTGYPAETLSLDMDLEADLGIDSIKRVEIMSGLQEREPGLPEVSPENLGSLRTLGQIVEYLATESGGVAVAVAAPARGAASAASIVSAMLEVVCEKTGYPADMIQLEMDLEADLGVDSIKRVEILSAFQERVPKAPEVSPDDLGRLRTLKEIIEFISAAGSGNGLNGQNGQSDPARAGQNSASMASISSSRSTSSTSAAARLVATEPAIAGYAPEAGRAAGLAPGEVWVSAEGGALADAIAARIQAAGHLARRVSVLDHQIAPARAGLSGLIIVAPDRAATPGRLWDEASERFARGAYLLARAAGPGLCEAAGRGGAVFATVSRLDGQFGLDRMSEAMDPVMGALAGLAKTAAQEWPGVRARAFDVEAGLELAGARLEALAAEILSAGPVETGMTSSGFLQLTEAPTSPTSSMPSIPSTSSISAGDVWIITGGARGVTAGAALEMGRAYGLKLALWGRSPEPVAEPEWLRGVEGEAAMKRALSSHAGNGAPLSPRALEEEYRRWSANREVARTLERMRAAGIEAIYQSVDARDAVAVGRAVTEAERRLGPVRGLMHGAGVLADRLIIEKTPEQFDAVFNTKIQSLRIMLEALAGRDLRGVALFSSISGRRGRRGQVDYAMANEALNKIGRRLAAASPQTRVVAANWGPWDGGMVSEGLKKVFAREGAGLIPLEAGAEWLARAFALGAATPVEVVVMAAADAQDSTVNGNGNATHTPVSTNGAHETHEGLNGSATLCFERELDLERHEFLRSHVIAGRPTLPMAMMIEWMGHAALALNAGYTLRGLDDLRVFRPVKVDPTGPAPLVRVVASPPAHHGDLTAVTVELRTAAANGNDGAEAVHARAVAWLGSGPAPAAVAAVSPIAASFSRPIDLVYRESLFHGPHLHAIDRIESLDETGLTAWIKAGSRPDDWMIDPLRSSWIADPMTLDAAIQLAVVWNRETFGLASLPLHLAEYRLMARSLRGGPFRAELRGARATANMSRSDVILFDREGAAVASLRGIEMIMDASMAEDFRRNRLREPVGA